MEWVSNNTTILILAKGLRHMAPPDDRLQVSAHRQQGRLRPGQQGGQEGGRPVQEPQEQLGRHLRLAPLACAGQCGQPSY